MREIIWACCVCWGCLASCSVDSSSRSESHIHSFVVAKRTFDSVPAICLAERGRASPNRREANNGDRLLFEKSKHENSCVGVCRRTHAHTHAYERSEQNIVVKIHGTELYKRNTSNKSVDENGWKEQFRVKLLLGQSILDFEWSHANSNQSSLAKFPNFQMYGSVLLFERGEKLIVHTHPFFVLRRPSTYRNTWSHRCGYDKSRRHRIVWCIRCVYVANERSREGNKNKQANERTRMSLSTNTNCKLAMATSGCFLLLRLDSWRSKTEIRTLFVRQPNSHRTQMEIAFVARNVEIFSLHANPSENIHRSPSRSVQRRIRRWNHK